MKSMLLILLMAILAAPAFSQNITNSLGPGGVFSIKDVSTTYVTVNQANGLFSLNKNLSLLSTTDSSLGVILKGGTRFIHDFAPATSNGGNTFIGSTAGNFTMFGTGISSSFNTGIGNGSLRSLSTAYANTAIGYQSASANLSGSQNTVIGYQVAYSNIGGSYNNFIGYQSGYSNTSGAGNNFIGRYAGYSNLTSSWNTFLGDRAGYHTTSDRNVFVGADAGFGNVSGQYNCYVGLGAGYSNITGAYSCYYGYEAGYSSTGNYNNYYGYEAGHANTTGMGNGFYGRLAGYANTGSWNTFLGDRAGLNNTSGTQNILIGADVGLTMTTGNYNTLLGNGCDVSLSSLTNATAIGYGATVNASNKIRLGNSSISVIEGQVAFTSASDMRLKKNIHDISSGLAFIMKLHPVEFQMKQGDGRINFGFIAQDIQTLVGTNNSILTIGGDKDSTLGLRYTDFIAPMVHAMQEQQRQLEAQNVTIANQQKQIDELRQSLETLSKK